VSFAKPVRLASLLVVSAAAVAVAAALGLGGAVGVETGPAVAAAPVERGVVDVDTQLGYQSSAAAGTGIVLSATGDVLTNNHVIRGATTIRVSTPAGGRGYSASVAGYTVSGDVALLKLKGATGLTKATIGNSATVRVGDRVTAVGNAGGTDDNHVDTGQVTGLNQTITVSDGRGRTIRLRGLIRTSVPLYPGDSGGPLLDSSGRVIGINAAATTGFRYESGDRQGFAIPINRALAIVKQINAGRSSSAIHVGPTAFLGVDVRDTGASSGVLVVGVVPGSAAEKAGLASGDVILSFGGKPVSSADGLARLVLGFTPGKTAKIRWLDELGNPHTATVRPLAGPPQ
jgi:S1-C subfamily serine protease